MASFFYVGVGTVLIKKIGNNSKNFNNKIIFSFTYFLSKKLLCLYYIAEDKRISIIIEIQKNTVSRTFWKCEFIICSLKL